MSRPSRGPGQGIDTSSGAPREWSSGEEIANSISHGVGFFAALVGAPFLLIAAMSRGGLLAFAGASIFAAATVFLYLCSAMHHALPAGRGKDLFEVLDHVGIFVLIAATFTPFGVGVLWGPWGWTLLTVLWSLAAIGVLVKTTRGVQNPWHTIPIYVVMGWLALIARPLWVETPGPGCALLLAGGLAYTGGLIFYVLKRMRYHHLVWHVCVLAGTTCHYFAVLWYAA